MLFKRIFKSKKPVNNIGISSSKQSVQIPNIHEIALKRAFFVYYDDKFSHIHRYACGESGIDEAIHDAIKGMEISKEEIISVKSELMDILDDLALPERNFSFLREWIGDAYDRINDLTLWMNR